MARERLTNRARQSADDKTPYPGSVNQEGRAEEGRGSMTYRTFEPSVENHEGQDLGWVHENDENRNEMNIGIPDPASHTAITASADEGTDEADFQRKCLKAAQCAELVLGDKVSDRVLLAQARDFLAMDEDTLDRTIERFNRTETLYTAEKGEAKEEKKEEAPAPEGAAPVAPAVPPMPEPVALPKAPAAPVPTVACTAADAPKVEETKKEEVKEEVKEKVASKARALNLARLAARTLSVDQCTRENIAKQSEKFASMTDEVLALALVAAGEQPVVDDAAVAPVKEEEKEKVAELMTEKQQCPVAGINESDFDLSNEFNDGPTASDAAADAELASVFADPMIDSMYSQSPVASINDDVAGAAADLSGSSASSGGSAAV
jgi:hypothetical protein